jgi:hypothetical protein
MKKNSMSVLNTKKEIKKKEILSLISQVYAPESRVNQNCQRGLDKLSFRELNALHMMITTSNTILLIRLITANK